MVATDVLLLLHAPPPGVTETDDEVPEQTTTEDVAVGVALTAILFVLIQPFSE
jgi:hypothetical protein